MSIFELPELADVHVDVEHESELGRAPEAFLHLQRLQLRNRTKDKAGPLYAYDCVARHTLDAVVIVLLDGSGSETTICLRKSMRPPLLVRERYRLPLEDAQVYRAHPFLWEIPAGLIEPDEIGEIGVARSAARETLEEVGAVVDPQSFQALGPALFLSPGMIAEKLHFRVAYVNATNLQSPTTDGSPVEEYSLTTFVPLADALSMCESGQLEDIKTEVAIRRAVARIL